MRGNDGGIVEDGGMFSVCVLAMSDRREMATAGSRIQATQYRTQISAVLKKYIGLDWKKGFLFCLLILLKQ